MLREKCGNHSEVLKELVLYLYLETGMSPWVTRERPGSVMGSQDALGKDRREKGMEILVPF